MDVQVLISWASVVNYQSLGMEIILDQSRLGVRLREPIKFQICVVGVAGEKKKKECRGVVHPPRPARVRLRGCWMVGEYH